MDDTEVYLAQGQVPTSSLRHPQVLSAVKGACSQRGIQQLGRWRVWDPQLLQPGNLGRASFLRAVSTAIQVVARLGLMGSSWWAPGIVVAATVV